MPSAGTSLGTIGSADVEVRAKIDTFDKDLQSAKNKLEDFDKSSISATSHVKDFETSAKRAANSTSDYKDTLEKMSAALSSVAETEKKVVEALEKHGDATKKAADGSDKAASSAKESGKGFIDSGEKALTAGYQILKWTGYLTLAAKVAYTSSPAIQGFVSSIGQMGTNLVNSIPYISKWGQSVQSATMNSATFAPIVARAGVALGSYNAIAGATQVIGLAQHFTGATAAAYAFSPAVRQVANQQVIAGLKAIPSTLGQIAPAAGVAASGLSRLLPFIAGAATFLAPWVALVGVFVGLFQLFKLGADDVDKVQDKLKKASEIGFSPEVLESYTTAFKEYKLSAEVATETFKKFKQVTEEKLGGSDFTKTLDELVKAGNFAKNANVELYKSAVTLEEKYRVVANLISVAISQRERLAALELAEKFLPPEALERLRAFGDTLAVIALKAQSVRKTPLIDDEATQRMLILKDRLDAAYKIIHEKFELALPSLHAIGLTLYEMWVSFLERIADIFKAIGDVVDLIKKIGPVAESVGTSISGWYEAVDKFSKISIGTIGNLFDQISSKSQEAANDFTKSFFSPVNKGFEDLNKSFAKYYEDFRKSYVQPVYEAVSNYLVSAFKSYAQDVTNIWDSTIGALIDKFSKFVDGVKNVFGAFNKAFISTPLPKDVDKKSWIDLSGAIKDATVDYEANTFASIRNEQQDAKDRADRAKSIAQRLDEQSVVNAGKEATEREIKARGDLSHEITKQSGSWDREIWLISRRISLQQAEAETYGKSAGELEALRVQHQLTEYAASHHLTMTAKMTKQMEDLSAKAREAKIALETVKVAYEIKRDRQHLLFTDEDVQIAEKLKHLYPEIADALNSSQAAEMRITDALRKARDIGQTFVTDFAMGLRQGQSALQSLQNALNKLADKLLEMAVQQLWQKAFGGALSAGLGGMFGFNPFGIAKGPTPVAHGGGVIGSGSGVSRMASPAMFIGAPRFHNGINLASDEIPAILQRGERVIPRGGGNGGGEVSNNIVIHNHGADVQTSTPQRNQSGGIDMRVVVRSMVSDDLASGHFDKAHAQRYGLRPTSARR